MQSQLALLCITPTQEQLASQPYNPHIDMSAERGQRFVTVYVNPIASHEMLSAKKPHFPKGSLIIKEKMLTATSPTPELLTVMRKREKGFNPAGGDWEYFVLDGTGKRVQSQGRLAACMSCHATWKDTDYVSRAYLDAHVRDKLR